MIDSEPTVTERSASNQRMLTFGSGGYVLVIAAAIGLALLAWGIAPAILRHADRPPGDGSNPETYGFDLTNLTVPRDGLVAALLHREIVPVMDDPPVMTTQAVLDAQSTREKYLVPSDVVVGVAINGEARAYPLLVLTNHEIVNDELGGRPIAVTYHPISDSIAVFDRRPSSRDGNGGDATSDGSASRAPLRFGASGLLYNASMLMYDRQENMGGESLWSQVLGEPVSGPAVEANLVLDRVPAQIVQWAEWREVHPQTTVIKRDPAFMKRYKKVSYTSYYESDAIWYPMNRELPHSDAQSADETRHPKARTLTVHVADQQRSYFFDDLEEAIHRTGNGDVESWTDTIGGRRITFSSPVAHTQTVRVATPDGDAVVVTRLLWFVHYAMYPDDAPVRIEGSRGAGE